MVSNSMALHEGSLQEKRKIPTSSEPEEWLWACWELEVGPRALGCSLMGRSMLLATDIPDRRCCSSLCK